jgi:import inner membrane translocase subunit TIM22
VPIWPLGKEPLPLGLTEEDRAAIMQQQQYSKYASVAMESCAVKTVMAGTMGEPYMAPSLLVTVANQLVRGFGIGAFFSLMSASLAYEDPLLRQQSQAGMNTTQKAGQIFKEMGRGMWSSGKGFGKVGALFAGIECCIEGVCVEILVAYGTPLTIP